ncbi:DUF4427 domain-containing protein [Brevundimonas sp. BH3]|uniref:DUF4427 domain-containing protein n=1 Tax=Brevundimonas sp. BH3 TaxID=3133089 RepID=UPI00324F1B30
MTASSLNNIRFDLSPYLIHFFRKLDIDSSSSVFAVEDWGPGAIVEDTKISPLFLLRNAIRSQRLWATWSVRGGCRTIYGPDPAVCFTDMPIGAFLEAGRNRQARGQAMSPFGILLPKLGANAAGARPAIYGLNGAPNIPGGKGGGLRVIPPNVLPLAEQHRYVTLSADGVVDWTHEREWRWPCRESLIDYSDLLSGPEIPGFSLDLKGMGVVVRTQAQADKVLHDLLVLSDQGAPGRYDFIIVGDKIGSLKALRDPVDVQAALVAAAIDLSSFRSMDNVRAKSLVSDFDACVAAVNRTQAGNGTNEKGGCWLWLTDAKHEMTRALRQTGRVTVNSDGRYLVDVTAFDPILPLAEREDLMQRLANLLDKRHNLLATYHSVLGKIDPNATPHYSDPPIENRLIFNYAHDEADE